MTLVNQLQMACSQAGVIEKEASLLVMGKQIRITCKYWNGQVYGRSKKPLTGKVFKVAGLFFDKEDVCLWLEGQLCSIRIQDVEFL